MPGYIDARNIDTVKLVNAGTGTITSDAGCFKTPKAYFLVQIVAGTGVSAGVIAIEGSLDGTNWSTGAILTSAALAAPGVYTVVSTVPTPYLFVRARTTTPVAGGNVDVTVAGY